MEAIWVANLAELTKIVVKMNPLKAILDEKTTEAVILASTTDISLDLQKAIRYQYRKWVMRNHSDS